MSKRIVDEWGRVIMQPDAVVELLMRGVDISTIMVEETDEIDRYNELCRTYDKLNCLIATPAPMDHSPEEEHGARAKTWFISNDIQQINVREFILEMCDDQIARDRVNLEMDLYEERDLIPLLQLMIYLVDHFRQNKVVWGVGRGSSVSSYVLFLIGVHKIDSLVYDLNIRDFLK